MDKVQKNLESEGRLNLEQYVSVSLVDVVTEKIRSNIYSGKYLPGQRLVVREISEELGVSHTPVKDALNRLVSEGYVVALPRRSMVVREYSNIEFIDNYDQRLMIELYYAEEIIKRGKADRSIISDMEKYYGEMEDFLHKDGELAGLTWVNCETELHRRYMEGCSNQRIYDLYCKLDTNKSSYMMYLNNNKLPLSLEFLKKNNEEHKALIEAIKSGDARQFGQVVAAHLVRSCAVYAIDQISTRRFQQMKENAERFIGSLDEQKS